MNHRIFIATGMLLGASLTPIHVFASDEPASGWSLGAGAIASDRGYIGEGNRIVPFPFVGYEGERFFIRGPELGVKLMDGESFDFDIVARGRFDGFDAEDLDIDGLEDRDDGVDAGFVGTFSGGFGRIEFSAVADVTDTSDGQEVRLEYGYPFRGGRTTITPSVAASWLSEDLADYYFGTLPDEILRDVPAYAPGDVLVPEIGVSMQFMLNERWSLFGQASYRQWPNEIRDSPLIDSSGSGTLVFGAAYRF